MLNIYTNYTETNLRIQNGLFKYYLRIYLIFILIFLNIFLLNFNLISLNFSREYPQRRIDDF